MCASRSALCVHAFRSVCLVCARVSVGLPCVCMRVGRAALCVHVSVGLPCVRICVGRSAFCVHPCRSVCLVCGIYVHVGRTALCGMCVHVGRSALCVHVC